MSYRERFPKLDQYLFGWIFDFAKLHQLDFTMPKICDLQLPSQTAIRDLLLDQHSNEQPLRLPFPLICSLCDYSIMGSKFYKDGHQQLMQEAIPRVVALADAVLLKEKGRGIFAIYGPNRPRKQSYYAFQSAVCPEANKRIDLSIKAYSVSTRLRNYVNQLVRYSENVLRSLYGYRGRLRGVELESELSSLVESFLKKEYTPKKNTEKAPPKQVEVKLDFDSIASLRAVSYTHLLYGIGVDDRMFTVTKSYLHREMDRGSKEAGVPRIRIHDIRHSAVSLLIDMGFSATAIADRVGHESIDITYNYAHLFPSKQTEMADKLNMERGN